VEKAGEAVRVEIEAMEEEQVKVAEEAAEINLDLVLVGSASVQSAVTRNHTSLVNVASTAPVQNAGRK
jgi:hypothetical protein